MVGCESFLSEDLANKIYEANQLKINGDGASVQKLEEVFGQKKMNNYKKGGLEKLGLKVTK